LFKREKQAISPKKMMKKCLAPILFLIGKNAAFEIFFLKKVD